MLQHLKGYQKHDSNCFPITLCLEQLALVKCDMSAVRLSSNGLLINKLQDIVHFLFSFMYSLQHQDGISNFNCRELL